MQRPPSAGRGAVQAGANSTLYPDAVLGSNHQASSGHAAGHTFDSRFASSTSVPLTWQRQLLMPGPGGWAVANDAITGPMIPWSQPNSSEHRHDGGSGPGSPHQHRHNSGTPHHQHRMHGNANTPNTPAAGPVLMMLRRQMDNLRKQQRSPAPRQHGPASPGYEARIAAAAAAAAAGGSGPGFSPYDATYQSQDTQGSLMWGVLNVKGSDAAAAAAAAPPPWVVRSAATVAAQTARSAEFPHGEGSTMNPSGVSRGGDHVLHSRQGDRGFSRQHSYRQQQQHHSQQHEQHQEPQQPAAGPDSNGSGGSVPPPAVASAAGAAAVANSDAGSRRASLTSGSSSFTLSRTSSTVTLEGVAPAPPGPPSSYSTLVAPIRPQQRQPLSRQGSNASTAAAASRLSTPPSPSKQQVPRNARTPPASPKAPPLHPATQAAVDAAAAAAAVAQQPIPPPAPSAVAVGSPCLGPASNCAGAGSGKICAIADDGRRSEEGQAGQGVDEDDGSDGDGGCASEEEGQGEQEQAFGDGSAEAEADALARMSLASSGNHGSASGSGVAPSAQQQHGRGSSAPGADRSLWGLPLPSTSGSGASAPPQAHRPPRPPGHPGFVPLPLHAASSSAAAAAAAGAAPPGSGPAFWGGLTPRLAKKSSGQALTAELVAQLPGPSPRMVALQRPGTASSYWSSYDLDEDGRKDLDAPAASSSRGGSQQQRHRGNGVTRSGSLAARVIGAGGPGKDGASAAVGPKSPTRRPDQAVYTRVLHPAVVMDTALLTPCPRPIAEVPLDVKGRAYPYVLPPTFPGAYPTIAFMGSAEWKQSRGLHPLMRVRMMVKYAGIANSPVKAAFKESGWVVTKGKTGRWSVCWGHIFTAEEFAGLHEFQRVNHFPGTWELGRKDYLYRNISAMRRIKGEAFDVVPRFFILPRDYDEFQADVERDPKRMYIQKPVNSSRGRGVRMVVSPSEVSRDVKDVLVQHYIHNPYTIKGYKFDMRLYVAATCFDPLRLYIYTDGLARFATERYSGDKAHLKKRCVHLTNYSVNKKSTKFVANTGAGEGEEESEGEGSKWSIRALREHVEKEGRVAWEHVWKQVHDIVAVAVLSAEPRINTEVKMKVPHRNICFEVWGFDIMLDDTFRAWLIEVNTCPALAADAPVDKRVKNAMVADVMNMLGPVPYDPEVYDAEQEARRQARLTGLPASGAAGGAAAPGKANAAASGATQAAAGSKAGGKAAGGGGAAGGGAAAGVSGAAQLPKTLKEAEELDFRGLAPDQLPDVIIETEAEYARRRGWERVFPCTQDPNRYLDLFHTPRSSNIMVCKYYAQKAGVPFTAGAPRPGTAAALTGSRGNSRTSSRPAINDWRPGGS